MWSVFHYRMWPQYILETQRKAVSSRLLEMSTLTSYAVVTSDKHGTILSVNRKAMQMFGYSQEELVGKKVNILMPAPYSEQHDTYISRYHHTREAHIIGGSRGTLFFPWQILSYHRH